MLKALAMSSVRGTTEAGGGATTPTDFESHVCDRMALFTLAQWEQGRFSTKTVDNFVDNLVLWTGDAVQSRV